MNKHLFVVLCFVCLIVSGCGHTKTIKHSYSISVEDDKTLKAGNNWFFESDSAYLSADITISNITAYESGQSLEPIKTQPTNMSFYKVLDMQNGSVYKLVIEPVEDLDGYLVDARLNLYFYVTPEKIYRIWSYVYENSTLKEFYDNDQLLRQILDTEEKIINNSYLACQQENLPDSLKEGEAGMHNCIEINQSHIESRMWDITDNGETYFYESFSWELSKGLVAYRSGFRAERDILHLNNISIVEHRE